MSRERNYLSSLYPGYSWQERVAKMPNDQVIAIYRRFQRDGFPRQEPKLNQDLILETPKPTEHNNEQIRLFEGE